ncbi:MAG: sigma 54-interacting transcriptional regulator [Verrucomicrobia bacterium]|nr:sigma 54-interacting transcriptional regulator [Verrucomicrobiota bacterium]MBU4247229.1 sigma 54-interacting transcriptional regulator [Verrucomicrobiota bacterium]MBU4289965.1 sigma 54-interacting transcriptional regulator [Verrucomicrobiota bacterium]MBU4498040.1 sigma 54-interacting transcriptional regulator [Verrucomicrobiota bacterium]MCG2679687.1 sigma 54-interacting transcriptional regulator [Kiritimatiellia bacterium]
MNKTVQLSDEDREFFRLVAAAAFSNPFSDERVETDLRIIAQASRGAGEDRIQVMMKTVATRVAVLDAAGLGDLRRFAAEDREIVQVAFLFDNYYQLIDAFDQLILDQIRAGDDPLPAPFAASARSLMTRRGFSAEAFRHYFAVFYQLRRAFYFIDRGLVGHSPCMKTLRKRLWTNVFTHDIRRYERLLWDRMEDFSTLLLGETGTGKGAAAAAIGRSGYIPFNMEKECFSESFTRSFVSINLSQFSPTLLESELFGHRKGAFTGAVDQHEGILGRCSPHGAIFLDEIGEVAVPIQIKLLQVLQERIFSPVGSHEKLRFRGRVIAATNKPLDELRRQGRFRDDFFYRLCSDVITVPSLRQRLEEEPGELNALLNHVIQRLIGQESESLAAEIREVFGKSLGERYPWPGNVRELEQAVRRIMLTKQYEGDLMAKAAPDAQARLLAGIEGGCLDAEALLSAYCTLLYQRHGTYEEVARHTRLDRRTVKKYILSQQTAGQ